MYRSIFLLLIVVLLGMGIVMPAGAATPVAARSTAMDACHDQSAPKGVSPGAACHQCCLGAIADVELVRSRDRVDAHFLVRPARRLIGIDYGADPPPPRT